MHRVFHSRFTVAFLGLLAINACAWWLFVGRGASALDLLRVDLQGSTNTLAADTKPKLTWRFNLAVADRDPARPPVLIRPELAGAFAWDDDRTLTFTPAKPLPVATQWDFVVARDRVKSVEGCVLPADVRATRQTASLKLVAAKQIGFADDEAAIELTFNDAVLPGDVAARVRATTGQNMKLDTTVASEKPGKIVVLRVGPLHPLADGRDITLNIAKGLSASSGTLGLAADQTMVVDVRTELVLNTIRPQPNGNAFDLRLDFNGTVNLGAMAGLTSVQPAVSNFRMEADSGNSLRLSGDFKPATRYAVTLAAPPAGPSAVTTARPETRTVFVPDLPRDVGFEHDTGYLSAAGRRTVYAWATNVAAVAVDAYRVYDSNLVEYSNATRDRVRQRGTRVASQTIKLDGRKNVRQPVAIKLDELLPPEHRGDGVFEIVLRAVGSGRRDASGDDDDFDASDSATTLVSLSDIGLTAKFGDGRLTAWTLSLTKATPLPGTRVRVYSDKNQFVGEATAGADGVADVPLRTLPDDEQPSVVLAERGDGQGGEKSSSVTALRLRRSAWDTADFATAGRPYLRKGYEAFVYADRGVFRPGEGVPVRAIVRGPDGATPPNFPVQWVALDGRGRVIEGPMTTLDTDGCCTWTWPTSDATPTGTWNVALRLPGGGRGVPTVTLGDENVQVEDFMPDRLKIALTLNGKTPPADAPLRVTGDTLDVGVQADYLFGQPAAGAEASLYAYAKPAAFAPKQWPGYTFDDAADKPLGDQTPSIPLTLDAKGGGHSTIALASLFTNANHPAVHFGPWHVRVAAEVRDDGRRTQNASIETFVDTAADYLGLKPAASAGAPGVATSFDVMLVKPAGERSNRSTTLKVRPYRVVWNNLLVARNGRYVYDTARVLEPVADAAPADLDVVNGRAAFGFTPPRAGRYVIAIGEGETPTASVSFDVTGGQWDDSVSRENPERLEVSVAPAGPAILAEWSNRLAGLDGYGIARPLVSRLRTWRTKADNAPRSFKAGDVVQVTVKSPFAGTLLLSVETDTVIERRTLAMTQPAATFFVRLDGRCRPNAFVSASVIRGIDTNATWRTHRAYGMTAVKLDEPERRLNVAVTSPADNKPGQTMPVSVRVVSANGQPVANAAVTVVAVDEGVLAVTKFQTPEPADFFAAKRGLGVRAYDLYGQLVPDGARPEKNGDTGGDNDVMDKVMAAASPPNQPSIRAKRVKPVALRSGVLHTEADGVARTDFPLPQFSGTLRVMAVASSGPATGSADRPARTRGNVVVQASWPRFAAPGDHFAVPVVVFNTGKMDAAVQLRFDCTGPLRVASKLDGKIIPAGGQATYQLDVTADNSAGVANANIVATMNGDTAVDAVELPVRPPSAAVTLSDAQVVAPGQAVSFDPGPPMLGGTEAEQIRVSPQPQILLPEGLDYLNRYPYGCCEQTTSTLMPLLALGDLGKAIDPKLFDADDVRHKIETGLSRLALMQRGDGGLSMWPGGGGSWPTGSVYAAHFVALAGRSGYVVPQAFRDGLYDYVRSLAMRSSDEPWELETQAYACYVLALAERADRAAMNRLAATLARPPVANQPEPTAPTRLLLAASFALAGQRTQADALVPSTPPVPRDGRDLGGTLGSPVADRALLLHTLLAVRPEHPAVAGLVEQLVTLGRKGEWRSTHDTAIALVALADYQKRAKDVRPFTAAKLSIGDAAVATSADGKALLWRTDLSAGSAHADALPAAPEKGTRTVSIDGPAEARGYVTRVRIGVPMRPMPAETGRGMRVSRRLLALDGKTVLGDRPLASGQLVKVELTITADRAMDNVVVEDLLPAGLEVENPRLGGQGYVSIDARLANAVPDLSLTAPADIRDDRVVLYARLPAGTRKFEYIARAVTVGTFVAPPLRAECMYDRATFGQTTAGTLTVEPAPSAAFAKVELP